MVHKTIGFEALEQLICDFCRRITPDFENLCNAFLKAAPNVSPQTLAQYFMEFGRGQISQIDEPDENEKRVIQTTISSLNLDHMEVAFFHAYASGCIMGLVSKKELPGTLIVAAFEIAAYFAFQKYAPETLQSGIRPNALLEFAGETSWEALRREHQNLPWDIE
jgi:hypothetical protein